MRNGRLVVVDLGGKASVVKYGQKEWEFRPSAIRDALRRLIRRLCHRKISESSHAEIVLPILFLHIYHVTQLRILQNYFHVILSVLFPSLIYYLAR